MNILYAIICPSRDLYGRKFVKDEIQKNKTIIFPPIPCTLEICDFLLISSNLVKQVYRFVSKTYYKDAPELAARYKIGKAKFQIIPIRFD